MLAASTSKDPHDEELQLYRQWQEQKLHYGFYGAKIAHAACDEADRLSRTHPDDPLLSARHLALACQAMQEDPAQWPAAFELLAQKLLSKQQAASWMQSFKPRFAQWHKNREAAQKAAAKAKLPAPMPAPLALAFPKISYSDLTPAQQELLCTLAESAAACGDLEQAAAWLNAVSFQKNGVARALALDVRSRLLTRENPAQAIPLLEDALSWIKVALQTSSFADKPFAGLLQQRLQAQLSAAKTAAEAAALGKGYLDYRKARLYHAAGLFPLAALHYQDCLFFYPTEIYAQAAEAGYISCLRELGAYGCTATLAPSLTKIQEQLREAQTALAKGKELDASESSLAPWRLQATAAKMDLQRLKALPLAAKAFEAALALASSSAAAAPFGLYQGEIRHQAALTLFLQCDYLPALQACDEALTWCNEAPAHDAALAAFTLTPAAAKASQPPASPWVRKGWNLEEATIEPGILFHRQNSPWYMADLKKRLHLLAGLAARQAGKTDAAKTHWLALYDLDPEYHTSEAHGYGSAPQRLLWNLEHNPKGFFGPSEALASFPAKDLPPLLLAELAMECEQPHQAIKLYQLLAQARPKLSTDAAAYLAYAQIQARLYLDDKEAPKQLASFVQEAKNSPIGPYALAALAALQAQSSQTLPLALENYAILIKGYASHPSFEDWLFAYARLLSSTGPQDEAAAVLQLYLRRFPQGRWLPFVHDLINHRQLSQGA